MINIFFSNLCPVSNVDAHIRREPTVLREAALLELRPPLSLEKYLHR